MAPTAPTAPPTLAVPAASAASADAAAPAAPAVAAAAASSCCTSCGDSTCSSSAASSSAASSAAKCSPCLAKCLGGECACSSATSATTTTTPPTPSTDDAPIHVNGADPLGSNDLDDLDGAPLDVTDDFLADYLDPNPATLADALGDRWEVDVVNVHVAVGCYVACCYPAVGWEIGQVKKRLRRRETGWFDIRYLDPDHDGSFVMWSGRLYAGNRFGQGEDGTLIGPEVYGKWTVVKTK